MRGPRLYAPVIGPAVLAGLFLVSCSDDPADPEHRVPGSIVEISGDAQTGMVGTELSQPLVVEVRDQDGEPLPDATVNFVVVDGGGSVDAGSTETDGGGRAQGFWTLGTSTADSQRVEARAAGSDEVLLVFTATALPGPVASVVIAGDTIMLSWIGDTAIVSAQTRDQFGNPVSNAPIRYRLEGSADVVALDSITGVASALQPGSQRLRAAVGALSDTARIVVAPVAANLEPVADSIAVTSLQVPVLPEVVAYDSGGTVIAAPAAIVWRSLDPTIVAVVDSLTGASLALARGVARLEAHATISNARDTVYVRVTQVVDSVAISPPTLVIALGDSAQLAAIAYDSNAVVVEGETFTWVSADTVRVAVDATGMVTGRAFGPAEISATTVGSGITGFAEVTVGNADTLSIVIVSGNNQAGVVGNALPLPLRVRVQNNLPQPVSGVTVVWFTEDGIQFTETSTVTDDAGETSVGATLDTLSGNKQGFATIGNDTVTFSFVAYPDVPTTFSHASLALQTDTVGDVVPEAPRIRVTDQWGNGVPGVEVLFTAYSGSVVTGGTQNTAFDGYAAATTWQLDTVPGTDSLYAEVTAPADPSFVPLLYEAVVVHDSASTLRSLLLVADTVRESDSTEVRVQLVDRFGNLLIAGDGTVTFHTTLGTITAPVDHGDGSWTASLVPGGAMGLAYVHARLDGDSIASPDSVLSRSYQLTWLGTGGSTDFHAPDNWTAPGGPPSVNDSILVTTANAPPAFPVLTQNVMVEHVIIGSAAEINVGSFDLTVNGSFLGDDLSGGLSGTIGRLILRGVAKQLAGNMRALRVEGGSYTLTDNVNVTGGRIVVQGGRLRNTSFRIRVRPN